MHLLIIVTSPRTKFNDGSSALDTPFRSVLFELSTITHDEILWTLSILRKKTFYSSNSTFLLFAEKHTKNVTVNILITGR